MRINTNVSALNTQRMLSQNNMAVAKSIGRLSSGFRINQASDDAAGLAIANRLRGDQRSLAQAARNAEQANSVLQVMEGGATQVQGILERMKELATQSNSDTVDDTVGRAALNDEFGQLMSELDRIVNTTTFNGQTLLAGGFGTSVTGGTYEANNGGIQDVTLNGTAASTYTLANDGAAGDTVTLTDSDGVSQAVTVSADGKQDVSFSKFGITLELDDSFTRSDGGGTAGSFDGDTIIVSGTANGSFQVSSSGQYAGNDLVTLNAIDIDSTALGINADAVDTAANAQTALTNLDAAITTLGDKLGDIGAAQNRLGFALETVKAATENIAAAESTIRDADMAAEMTELSRNQILQQAGTAMLAQANQAPQGVLQLLR